MFSKIAGVTFAAEEGFENLQLGEELSLVREPCNPYDSFAVAVVRSSSGAHLGHVPAKGGLAREVSEALASGTHLLARVSGLTGKWLVAGDGTVIPVIGEFGVNIEILRRTVEAWR